jgi:MGT family glycosyltransferase
MSKILFASVPLAGHVFPAIPIARNLVSLGHEVGWYCGNHYRKAIEDCGANFFPYKNAHDFHDGSLTEHFPDLPHGSISRHARYYINHIFYDNLIPQYQDLVEILNQFDAGVLFTDDWFCGAIPLAEKKIIPWISYSNAPVFYYDADHPFPGSGMKPATSYIGRQRNKAINFIASKIFMATSQRYINELREKISLPAMRDFFPIHNMKMAAHHIKFNARSFDYPYKDLPENIVFAGPLVEENASNHFSDLNFDSKKHPLIFITQGTVNNNEAQDLIIPAMEAIQELDCHAIVTTGNSTLTQTLSTYATEKVIIRDFIPYANVIPLADLVISNGGFGSVITSLKYGKPLIIAGHSEDKPVVAALVDYCKVGIDLGRKKPNKKTMVEAIDSVLKNDIYQIKAKELSEDFKKYDGLKTSIEVILKTVNLKK